MVTFAGWLKAQSDRQDEVGRLARAWRDDSNHGTVRSPSGMRRHIEENWPEDDHEWTLAAIDQAVTEREQSAPPLAAVPDTADTALARLRGQREEAAGAMPGMASGAEQQQADAEKWAQRAADGRGEPRLTGDSSADLDEACRLAMGEEPPPYVPAGFTADDRELLTVTQRRAVWIELAMRMILGDQRAAEIDAVMDAALAPPEVDLVGAYAQADLQG